MDLIGGDDLVGAEVLGGPAAVFTHGLGIVLRAHADVQALVDAVRDAALTREEGVTDAGHIEQRRSDDRRAHSSSSKAGGGWPGSKIAQALKSSPISSPPIKRVSWRPMVAERSGRARTKASARSPMPSRARSSVWVRI